MPRKAQPPRLWLRADENVWIILDRGKQLRTGCPEHDTEGAEKALATYIAAKTSRISENSVLPAVGHVLAHYLDDRRAEVGDPARLEYCAKALATFWANRPTGEVTRANCKEYAALRKAAGIKPATIRRELSMLKSALIFCDEKGRIESAFSVWLPKKPPPRRRWMDRSELAVLLRAASPHLRRFILISFYTGRRHRAVLRLRWEPQPGCGWIDMRNARIHFLPEDEDESAKGRGSIPIPATLLVHLRRWYRLDRDNACRHIVQYRGKPVSSIRKAMQSAVRRAKIPSAVPHTLKHSAVTMFFERGGDISDGADYFATTQETLSSVYRQHSPQYARRGSDVMGRRR